MSDFNIQIAVDSRKAQTGVTQFTRSVSDSLKALRQFDSVSKSAFASLDKIGKTNLGSLAKSARGTAQALELLNRTKINKSLVTNLQTLQKALAGFRFNARAISAVPTALAALNRIRIDGRLVTSLTQIKAALVGFRGPPLAAVRNLNALITGLAAANPARINAAAAALQRLNGLSLRVGRGALPDFSRSTNSLRGFTTQMTASTGVANMLRAALAGVSTIALGRSIYHAGTEFISLQRTLGAVASSAGEVEDQLAFLQNLTGQMPISLSAVTGAYGKFAVAARLSGVSLADTQKVFSGFSTAFAAMGVGADVQERGFVALQQMLSKGRISSEELRQQLAEALPGAMSLLAESLDVSVAKLSKMLEAGEVTSDALINMSTLLTTRFGPSMAAAMNSSAAQVVNLQNSWTDLQRIIFDSGFSSGIAAMAKQLSEVFRSDDAKRLAADIGASLGNMARGASAFVKVLVENRDAVRKFFEGFKVFAGIMATTAALKVLGFSVAAVVPILTLASRATSLLGRGLLLIASGGALKAIADGVGLITKRLWLIPVAVGASLAALDQFANNGAITDKAVAFVADFSRKLMAATEAGFGKMMGADGPFGAQFAEAKKEADAFAKSIADADLLNADVMRNNAARESAKLTALTAVQQSLFDEVNTIGKANDEYTTQIALLDEIAKMKGIDAGPFKATLAARSLDDRNPVGAMVQGYAQDLASLKAKTGEQKALNDAKRDELDLLKKGIVLNQQQVAVIADYHKGIAMMSGELGNGIERWTTTVGDFNSNMQEAIKDGIGGLSDELTNFVTGAEADFAGLARSILKTFVQISMDSLLKDLFKGMGMDGATNGASMADQALAKLATIGENITTAMTNVYTSGLSINGVPIGTGLGTSDQITRAPLANIPGSSVAAPFKLGTDRFPLEPSKALPAGWDVNGPIGANTTGKTNRLGYINPDINPERFAPGIAASSSNPFLNLIGRAEGTDRGRGYNETLGYGAFTGGNRNLTSMSLDQIDALQSQMLQHPANTFNSSALGRYQITRRTMRGLRGEMGLSGDQLYDPSMQDQMAMRLMERRGNNVAGLRNEWEGLRRVDPATIESNYAASAAIDPATTQGIDALNAKLQTVGTTAASTAPAFDTMRAANQNLATASTMAGTNLSTAGTMASTAGPQFTTAGQSIQQAGVAASTAGTQAQAGASGVGGFGQGIQSLLGPLASAIPGLGQFGGMILQLASSLLGGGGLAGGLFAEGGYSTSPVARASLPAGLWSNAPHYADGTANTSGGMPAVLHPNEAVIPLTRGRKIPVDLDLGNDNRTSDRSRERPVQNNVFNLNGIRDFDTFKQSKHQTKTQMLSAMQRAQMRA
ncbi:MAG: hypothetical protein EOS26_10335 [Mesorhizobium sp.]|nr:MAG: hypothetical protein EOS26_10335 [Mesorhizobium sp.]